MDKTQLMATKDSPQQKMMADSSVKLFDKLIRVYGNTGIITGRAQAFVHDTYVVEFLYTAIFVKHNDKWMFTGWQGTISKDSPKPPPMPQGWLQSHACFRTRSKMASTFASCRL